MEGFRPLKNLAVIKLRGIDSIDQGETLVGRSVFLPVEELPRLEDGRYYIHQLMDFRVETGDGKPVGTVTGAETVKGPQPRLGARCKRRQSLPHLIGRLVGERQGDNRVGRDTRVEHVGDAMSYHAGLPAARAS